MTPVALRSERGASTEGHTQLVRYSLQARLGRALGSLGLGLVGAALCLPVPGVHLLTTWALPLAGALAAWGAWQTHTRLEGLRGPCPDCGAEVALDGGRLRSPHWSACPRCHHNVQVQLIERPG